MQSVGCFFGWLLVVGGVISLILSQSHDVAAGERTSRAVASILIVVSGGLGIALSHVGYQAAIVVIDIADTLIDGRTS